MFSRYMAMSWGYQLAVALVPAAPVPTVAHPEPEGLTANVEQARWVPFQPTMS